MYVITLKQEAQPTPSCDMRSDLTEALALAKFWSKSGEVHIYELANEIHRQEEKRGYNGELDKFWRPLQYRVA